MGGRGKDGGTDFLAAGGEEIVGTNGGTKGWMGGAGLGVCAIGASGPLPICGAIGGANDGAGGGACIFAAGTAGTGDSGTETGDALCTAAAARGFRRASMLAI